MPIIYQAYITRADVQRNRDALYVFGDNWEERGLGGQAAAMRGEPNAVGIPTKKKPTWAEDAFFTDADAVAADKMITPAFERLAVQLLAGRIVVWPLAGIGTGRAELQKRAPAIWDNIANMLGELQYLSDHGRNTP